ncbi:MAG: beta-ketoacyl synthase N-terminal-like domain-containing protein [Pleurocapsa sp. MO_226.B13]|nr:beta-ketoacyl synthase N-terminal-like domain-containing protein [Pleurocapsa sp. MO_226.B13]
MTSSQAEPVAIIGMAGVFPEAKNLTEYWKNIRQIQQIIFYQF